MESLRHLIHESIDLRHEGPMPSAYHAAHRRPSLDVYLLGSFLVIVNGTLIESWPTGKAKMILKYLLLHRQGAVSREALMDTFWPGTDREGARNCLNVTMHRLRRAIRPTPGAAPIVALHDGYFRFNQDVELWSDIDAFLAQFAEARALDLRDTARAMHAYAGCVALYKGELLAEDGYESWLEPVRQQYRDAYLAALDRLSRFHFAEENYLACIETSVKILMVDGCNEQAHCHLMRCYARLGQPRLAQLQYRQCVSSLARELGMPPAVDTSDLYRRIARREADCHRLTEIGHPGKRVDSPR
ncbi:MAG: BTAD domain-containing putative transcriptional regulator [Burkholderiales bacterium]